ncbi:TlpA disulfide reductase family protein [Pelagicoccus sp. SDUM812003]|uniref:TlpA family protein disulfide reductase n=1 Tax=Pelagicoccus sp. SDUM812003 TaxID=3041267 RepID=UPI00280CDB07|nr:TlpA disulfide reductase family protein [Pelagicoccus sp. SDUM812003]MDQ8201558.1 TlpA disulfide reductase family protein [Pelagicoccus sp. SDUM812003]
MKHSKARRATLVFLFTLTALVPCVSWGQSEASLKEQHDALIATARDESADYASAVEEAREAGMSSSWLLEADIVRALSTGDVEGILGLLPRLDAVGDDFRYGVGREFISAQQLSGFADTLRCVVAYREEDMERFERFAVESFRKAPGFNQAFGIGNLLSQYRHQQAREEAMADFRIPMDMVLANVEGESKTLAEWVGDDKALLLDFWASWCGPCIRLMPSLREKSAALSEQGIFVAGVNTDESEQLEKATKVREQRQMESVPWLLDRNGGDLSMMLMIDSIPRMVLVDPEGRVLYNGHPSDPKLGDALAKLDVSLPEEH